MVFKILDKAAFKKAYNTVFKEAFPPDELKPLSSMEKMRDRGEYFPCALTENGKELSYVCLWKDGRYVLIDYLCVPAGSRENGSGTWTIETVLERFPPDTVFIGEAEAPLGDPETDAIKYRRLGFYARTGAVQLSYDTALFGVCYKTIVWAKSGFEESEVLLHHRGFYERNLPPELFKSAFEIPLLPGAEPKKFSEWTE